MSEYEKIVNEGVQQQSAVRRKAAVRETVMVLMDAGIVAMACMVLAAIGFISKTFFFLLEEAVLVGAAYKMGGIWKR